MHVNVGTVGKIHG